MLINFQDLDESIKTGPRIKKKEMEENRSFPIGFANLIG